MSQKFRSDVSLLADDTLEELEASCRQLAVRIESSDVDVSNYEHIYADVVPEIIRYIRLLERNINRHEPVPVCNRLRQTANFFTDDELDGLRHHCIEITFEIDCNGSPIRPYDLQDDFKEAFPKLIHHTRLLERRMDQYQDRTAQSNDQGDILIRLQQVERSINDLKRRTQHMEDASNTTKERPRVVKRRWLTHFNNKRIRGYRWKAR